MSVICFVCHLPILPHQTPRVWEQGADSDRGFYHDDCIRCGMCGLSLAGPNLYKARRHSDRFLCDLHYSDVVAAENSDFAQQLREFKRHALGCAVARRKSSTTLVFPIPPQACPGEDACDQFPHRVRPTPGYWIECIHQSTEAPPEKLIPLEEVFGRMGTFELTSFEQETFERHFYATEHWNYFATDDELGPVILSLKQEVINNRDHFRIMVRTVSFSLHGLVPASCLPADRYNREDVVRSLSIEIGLHPHLQLGQLPSTPDELLKLDQVFVKSELKVGIIYVKEGQITEEEVLDNNTNSQMFEDFLQLLGDQIRLKGFDKYKGGLDTVHDLTGTHSVYTFWRGIEIMFHVSTMLPYEKHDPQKLQRKRHIGNDIVCVVFLEAENTDFSPSCIKSHFLHTFVVVQALPNSKETPVKYNVSVVSRDEVGAYKPYLWQRNTFHKEPLFREWLLTKIVNGERASYSAPKFARMQDRTRSQLLEDIVTNLQNHVETGQMPKPYRRGSWRPIGHMRPSSPLLDSVRDLFEGYEGLAKDFTKAFKDTNALCDVVFNVGQGREKVKVYAVRAMLAVRSRVFQEMLYGIASGLIGTSQSPLEALNRAVTPTNFSKSSNFLQVPEAYEHRPKSAPSSPMVMRAFSRLARWDWSGKSKNHLGVDSESLRRWTSDINCNEKRESKQDAAYLLPRLSMCADIQKVDRQKLMQSEFNIIEFDPDTFETLLEYLHTGSCPLTCRTIPGLICAAEHFDLPELLQACFHHAKQHLRINIVCTMMTALENYYWRYTAASELINMILVYVDARATQVFECKDFYELSESMVQMILSRELNIPEVKKFQIMLDWAHTKVNRVQCRDSKFEFRCTMERLTRDLKLYKISPNELIKVVLPTKAIRNERILETLMHQANSGMYRIQPSYLQECRANLQGRKESRADIMLYGGMMSFDRRDSILPPEPNFELQRHDSLLEEYSASIKRQESEDQEAEPPLTRQEIKRRSSRPDFRPLLHRRESRQTEKPLIQHVDSQERPSGRRDAKWWMSRQESKDDSSRSPESRHSQRRESKLYESKFYIWRHRQESKSQDDDSKGSDPKLSQRRDSRLYTLFHRQDSKAQDEDSPRPSEGRLSQRKDSRIHMWLHRQGSKSQDDEARSSEHKTPHRRDSRLFWFHKQDDDATKRLGKSEDSEEGLITAKVERKASTKSDSKGSDHKLHGWFSRRFSKPDDEVDLVNDDTDTDAHDTTVDAEEEVVTPETGSRSTQRRDSKLYTWLFKQQNSKSQEEGEGRDLRVQRSSAEKKGKLS